MRRLLLCCLVLFCLGFTQMGALVHEVGHYAQAEDRHGDADPKAPDGDKFCRLCVAFAQVAGAMRTSVVSLVLLALSYHHAGGDAALAWVSRPLAAPCRGPPHRLS